MKAILELAGGTWDQAKHSSAVEGKIPGGNVRKEAFEDLWSALVSIGWITSDGEPGHAPPSSPHASDATAIPELQTVIRRILLRRGQPQFRNRLLQAYAGRCAVTDVDVPEVLEAAHIRSHAEGGTMATSNGLLLRADIHTMFDLRLIAIGTTHWRVLVHPPIASSKLGQQLQGASVRLPHRPDQQPSVEALDDHRMRAGIKP